jgi:hypothetical protein
MTALLMRQPPQHDAEKSRLHTMIANTQVLEDCHHVQRQTVVAKLSPLSLFSQTPNPHATGGALASANAM